MSSPINVLFIGDVVGKLGRQAVKRLVPKLRRKHRLDFVVANIENLAHGKGITAKTLAEIKDAGIDAYTTGNHVWKQKEGIAWLEDANNSILRPANYPEGVPGRGYQIFKVKGRKVAVVNLMGRVFMKADLDDPFRKFDAILKQITADEVIVDLHAEATSEKVAFGWYAAGRASLIVGTHTHIPTADAVILPGTETGYVTDVGMVGPRDSVLGVDKGEIIDSFLTQLPVRHKMVDKGDITWNSVFAKINYLKSIHIKRIDLIVEGR